MRYVPRCTYSSRPGTLAFPTTSRPATYMLVVLLWSLLLLLGNGLFPSSLHLDHVSVVLLYVLSIFLAFFLHGGVSVAQGQGGSISTRKYVSGHTRVRDRSLGAFDRHSARPWIHCKKLDHLVHLAVVYTSLLLMQEKSRSVYADRVTTQDV